MKNKVYGTGIYVYSGFFYIMNMNKRISRIKYSVCLGIVKAFCRVYIRCLHAAHGTVCEKKI